MLLPRIQGSDQAHYRLRSEIWSTSTVLGPPSLWITINPSDLHDPIAQVVEQAVVYSTTTTGLSTLTFERRVVAGGGGVEERSEVMYCIEGDMYIYYK